MYRQMLADSLALAKTNPKRRSKETEKTNTLLAAIVECAEDAIIGQDATGTIITWNQQAEKLYGYTAEEIIGKPISLVIPPKYIQDAEGKVELQAQAITKREEILNVSLITVPLKNKQGEKVGISIVTKKTQEETQGEKSKDTFINIVSHELKTPITSIKAYAQILERKFTKNGDKESAKYMYKMHSQINRLTYLIRDLIDMNNIQTGELLINNERFDIEVLIDEIIEEIKSLAADIKIRRIGSIQKKINADRIQIGQVIMNLVSNAIKFSSKPSELIIHVKQTDKEVIIGIQDFGKGIEIEYQKRIFERFYRISREHSSEFPGFGVGLYISSEIIKSHHGRIWVKSDKDAGSIFYFSLPM